MRTSSGTTNNKYYECLDCQQLLDLEDPVMFGGDDEEHGSYTYVQCSNCGSSNVKMRIHNRIKREE